MHDTLLKKKAKGYMITYKKFDNLDIISCSNSNFVRCQDSKCSMSRYIYMLHIGLRNFVTNLHVVDNIERPLKIYCNNNLAILYSNNNKNSTKSKFINIKFFVVKERVQK
ncbi:hypothetical protein CR513_50998, partial [Mucuna pruriens]